MPLFTAISIVDTDVSVSQTTSDEPRAALVEHLRLLLGRQPFSETQAKMFRRMVDGEDEVALVPCVGYLNVWVWIGKYDYDKHVTLYVTQTDESESSND